MLTIQSIRMVLRKSRNENWMLIMMRVMPGHSTVLHLSFKSDSLHFSHSIRAVVVQGRHGMGGSPLGSRHYHKNVTPPELGHFILSGLKRANSKASHLINIKRVLILSN
jgi:hypothetical protein